MVNIYTAIGLLDGASLASNNVYWPLVAIVRIHNGRSGGNRATVDFEYLR
jgi:hypothetical protein